MVGVAIERFRNLIGCIFDKKTYNPSNLKDLNAILERVVLPKKEKLSQADNERKHGKEHAKDKLICSAAESFINHLENHGV